MSPSSITPLYLPVSITPCASHALCPSPRSAGLLLATDEMVDDAARMVAWCVQRESNSHAPALSRGLLTTRL